MSWQTILTKCANVERVRIEGIDMEDDGKLLERYKSLKGVDASGSAVGYCALVGRVRLTRCLTDEEWAEYHDAYPELVIVEPEWTVVQFNDDVSASANISNLDNRTGYEFDNKYAPSGHVARILARRHRCLAKKTAEGEMTIFPLHDEDSNYFADADDVRNATPAVLTGEMGDVVMYEPHYWYKGVNDFVGRKKYALYSSNEECPHATASVRIEKESLRLSSGSAISVAEDKGNVSEAIVGKSGYSKCSVDVAGYKQVRFPSVVSEEYGAIMTDADGRILSRINTPDGIGIISGMYVYVEIPPAATTMYFTIEDTAPFDHVLLIGSNEMEAVEPDWVEHEACLTGVFEACLVNDALHSYADMLVLDSLSWLTAKNYGEKRGKGFRMIDYEMHKDVANLFFAKYGERDCQGTCGRGGSESARALGLTIVAGMTDTTANTDNPTEETAYLTKKDITKNIISPNMLGYENWYSCKAEFMLMKMNEKQVDYILRSVMPDGTERKLENIRAYSSIWTKNVAHGRYMDVVPVSNGGSSKSYYYDYALIQSYSPASVYRSAYRSNNFENGVSFIYTSNNYSSTDTIFSSRMAFRGKIKFASSAAEFIAIKEID